METKQRTTLTQGSVAKGMLLFALPIFVSNLFQQLYNACLLYTSDAADD